MNEEKIRIKKLKADYKELKKLYKKIYGNSKNRLNEDMKAAYKEFYLKIDANISIFIKSIEKIPKYDEAKDEEVLKKRGLKPIINESNKTVNEVYDRFQYFSDKELKKEKKNLKKKLHSSKRNLDEAFGFAKEYFFIRKKLHYRNEMNKAVGIDVHKLYNQYVPVETSAKKEAKRIFIEYQTKVEQLNEDKKSIDVINDISWSFSHDLSKIDSGKEISEVIYHSIDNHTYNNPRVSLELCPHHYAHTYEEIDDNYYTHTYEEIDNHSLAPSYISIGNEDSGYETSRRFPERTSTNIKELSDAANLPDTHYNKLFEITEQNSSFRRSIVKKGLFSNESITQENKKTIETVRIHAEAKAKRQIQLRERKHYATIRAEKESFA